MQNMTNRNSCRSLAVILAGVSLVLLISSLCSAAVIPVFKCDFEDEPIPGEISGAGSIADTQGYVADGLGDNFLRNSTGGFTSGGPMGTPGEPTLLTLTDLPFHTHVEIRFDLAIIDSWDGSGGDQFSPDYFNVTVDDQEVFGETIRNVDPDPDDQSFEPAPEQVIVERQPRFDVGGGSWDIDSLYAMGPSLRDIPHSDSELVISFYADGGGWQGGADESWAIDNIEILLSIEASIDIKPETLNLKSKGVFTAFIDLPELIDKKDIDISTVECEGAPAVNAMMADDGRLIVKFDREDLLDVSPGDAVELTVTGELTNGTPFAGSDIIRVIDKGGKKK